MRLLITDQNILVDVRLKLSKIIKDLVKVIVTGHRSLTHFQSIPTFNDPKEGGFGKLCRKRRKCW